MQIWHQAPHDLTLGSPWEYFSLFCMVTLFDGVVHLVFLGLNNILAISNHRRKVCCENMQMWDQCQLWHSRPNTWLCLGILLQCWCWPVSQSDTKMHQCDAPMRCTNAPTNCTNAPIRCTTQHCQSDRHQSNYAPHCTIVGSHTCENSQLASSELWESIGDC